MVDFEFYQTAYLGSRIPEAAFPEFAARAGEALGRLKAAYTVEGSDVEEQLALCAMAEEIYASTGRRGGVSTATVGSVSVKYRDRDRALYDCAGAYLRIYRGVG